ncbi:MAG: methylmalonyl-CoA mutase family protein [Bacteroidota bacterium]
MSLFDAFPPISPAEWQEKITTDLKGKPLSRLDWHLPEGFTMPPFLTQEQTDLTAGGINSAPGAFPYRRGNFFNAIDQGWQMVQDISVHQPAEAKARISEALNAEIAAFRLYDWSETHNPAQLAEVLGAVDTRYHALHLSGSQDWVPTLASYLERHSLEANLLTGTFFGPEDQLSASLIDILPSSPYFRTAGISVTGVDDAGGTAVHQLAFALAKTVEEIQAYGSAEGVFEKLAFHFPIGSHFLVEIAKFRAFRMLVARLAEVYEVEGHEARSPFVVASTSRWNKTLYDAHNNLLRTTTEAMAAILGGAHAVNVRAFDVVKQAENAFSSRLARNIQHLLKHEAYLSHVQDPAGGSYYLESLTDNLAETAWKLFQEIEQKGGYLTCQQDGTLADWLRESREAKEKAIHHRKQVFVGVNQYPDPQETYLEGKVPNGRGMAAFEQLRAKVDQLPQRPEAFLLMFGKPAMRSARANFARNLLGAAGIMSKETTQLGSPRSAMLEAIETKAAIVVLCADDASYDEYASQLADQLHTQLQEVTLLLAGRPEGWEGYGMDDCLYAGMDALSFLTQLTQSA